MYGIVLCTLVCRQQMEDFIELFFSFHMGPRIKFGWQGLFNKGFSPEPSRRPIFGFILAVFVVPIVKYGVNGPSL